MARLFGFCFLLFCFCCGGIREFVAVLHALPLCGAAVTFFAAAKKVTKESGFTPPVPARIPLRHVAVEPSRSDAHTP
ncbi:hypothetical protein [Paraburkholderia sabiae]|uniref:hypothetical protein n=1 Tax=Paraburkholderia sabiae TaxID=273251 RepID=UPI001CC7F8D0|nr:hypothetical protein [Paraburkholderia sabiae]